MRTRTIAAFGALAASATLVAGLAGTGPAAATAYRHHHVIAYVTTVSNGTRDMVTPVDTVTGKALKPIPVGGNPDAIAVTPDGKTAYAVNQATSTVTPIRTATNKALRPIHIPGSGGYTGVIAISPNGKTAYVAMGGTVVVPIRTADNKLLKPISTGTVTVVTSMAFTPNGRTLYAATYGSVVPIRTATNTAGKPIAIAANGSSVTIALSPDGRMLYAANAECSPDRVWLTGQAELPTSQRAGSSGDRAFCI